MQFFNGMTFEGSFLHGAQCDGIGRLEYKNGDEYRGQFVGGLRDGQGKNIRKQAGNVLKVASVRPGGAHYPNRLVWVITAGGGTLRAGTKIFCKNKPYQITGGNTGEVYTDGQTAPKDFNPSYSETIGEAYDVGLLWVCCSEVFS